MNSTIRIVLLLCNVFILVNLLIICGIVNYHPNLGPYVPSKDLFTSLSRRISGKFVTKIIMESHLVRNLLVSTDVTWSPTDIFQCTEARFKNISFPMCIYDPGEDTFISQGILREGMWEAGHVQEVMEELGQEASVGLLDIGANLGAFSLTAAHLGYNVVAVEPTPATVRRLARSVAKGNIGNKIRILNAGVSNVRTQFYEKIDVLNKGRALLVNKSDCVDSLWSMVPDKVLGVLGHYTCDLNTSIHTVYLDDLVEVVPFKKAVLKMDIEGHEYLALKQASNLFEKVDILRVHMEWAFYKHMYQLDPFQRTEHIKEMLGFFLSRGYNPQYGYSDVPLDVNEWMHWPDDVSWHKEGHLAGKPGFSHFLQKL